MATRMQLDGGAGERENNFFPPPPPSFALAPVPRVAISTHLNLPLT